MKPQMRIPQGGSPLLVRTYSTATTRSAAAPRTSPAARPPTDKAGVGFDPEEGALALDDGPFDVMFDRSGTTAAVPTTEAACTEGASGRTAVVIAPPKAADSGAVLMADATEAAGEAGRRSHTVSEEPPAMADTDIMTTSVR